MSIKRQYIKGFQEFLNETALPPRSLKSKTINNKDPFAFYEEVKEYVPVWKGVIGDLTRKVTVDFLGFSNGTGAKKYKIVLDDFLSKFTYDDWGRRELFREEDDYYSKGKAEIVYGKDKTDIQDGGSYIVVKDRKLKI